MRQGKFYKVMLLALAVALLAGVSQVQRLMNHDRSELGLTRQPPLENAPPVLAFTTVALGGFRGLIANALWIRASELQEDDKFFEMVQLADWITKLEPHFVQVWLVQAWNMAYNISVKFKDPEDRWRWVQRGISLLRDEGLKYNPNETLIYRELSWFFQHKMGHNLDDAHMFYKQAWFTEMHELLGARPNYPELIEPQTEDARQRVQVLRERYKMDPQIMKDVDENYGPLEWRLPDAHAIYWAEVGRRKGKAEDQEKLQRSIYQTMQQAFERGAVELDKISGTLSLRPNIDSVANVNKSYEELMSSPDENLRDQPRTGHKNFLRKAPYFLYLYAREAEAAKWFRYLKEKYPDAITPTNLTLDEYVVQMLSEIAGETDVNKTRALVSGLIYQSYLSLVQDEDDRAMVYDRLAQRIWTRFQAKIEGAEQRVGLPPLAQMKKLVREDLLDPEEGLPPEFANRLRTKLGLPPPPAVTPSKETRQQAP